MWSVRAQAAAVGDLGIRTRITVRELIELHKSQMGYNNNNNNNNNRKRPFPPAPDQNTPPDRRRRTSAANSPHEMAAEEPQSPVVVVVTVTPPTVTPPAVTVTPPAPCNLYPDSCCLGPPAALCIPRPYVQSSPPPLPPPPGDLDLPPRDLDLPPGPAPRDLPRQQQPISLFEWQVVHECRQLGGVTAEMLAAQDDDGDTYLHVAVAQGKRALAYALAAKSSGTIDTKDHNGQSALQIAVTTNQHLMVHDLLLLGSNVDTRDHWGRSPLHVCAEKAHVVTLLTIHKTRIHGNGQPLDVDLYNYNGLSPLHVAVTSYNRLVRELRELSATCSLVAMELSRWKQQYVDSVKTLLLMGARCSTKDLKNGKTVLHLASEEAGEELFHLILKHPSSDSIVNEKTYSGNTALHVVCSGACHCVMEAVVALLRKGADPSARNLENEQPAHLVPSGPIGDKVRKMMKRKNVIYLTTPKI